MCEIDYVTMFVKLYCETLPIDKFSLLGDYRINSIGKVIYQIRNITFTNGIKISDINDDFKNIIKIVWSDVFPDIEYPTLKNVK